VTGNLIIALCLFAAVLIARLIYDVHLYMSGKPNTHFTGPVITVAVLIACTVLAGWLSGPMWFLSFWAIFDPAYNLLIGQKAGFIGTTAGLDQLQHKYPFLVWVKYCGAVVSIILFILFR
jgi:hypothetical protein